MQDGSITCSIESLSVYIEVMQTLFKLTAEKLAPARQLCKSSTWPQLRSMTSNINNWLYEVAVLLSQKLSRPPSHPLDQDIILWSSPLSKIFERLPWNKSAITISPSLARTGVKICIHAWGAEWKSKARARFSLCWTSRGKNIKSTELARCAKAVSPLIKRLFTRTFTAEFAEGTWMKSLPLVFIKAVGKMLSEDAAIQCTHRRLHQFLGENIINFY